VGLSEIIDAARAAMRHFDDWLDASEAQRAQLLVTLAAGDAAVFERVQALIAADARIDTVHFMRGAALLEIEPAGDAAQHGDLAGKRIGAWRVERLLGRGGMGEVWLAARDDGAHAGRAAIKLLRSLRGDVRAQERFLREGQILSRLEHPHIARLLDAGGLEDGQRYLVLEYVDGERIDDWCDRLRLPLAARLELFVQVCTAVAYAHANLVVHRDLKPSNIFVDAQGGAKLLDFGVAKLLEDEEGGAALTRASGVAITPEYAAPEQIENKPITVATDVYALGNVLYLLLSGRRPYDDNLATPAQWARAIVETEPRRLSASTQVDGAETQRRAQARATTPEQWRRALRGDLETIVAKALKKNPAERYASAQALADDIRRYLEHKPILARDDGWLYRTRKFVRRHRVGVGASALLAAAITTGIAGVVWQARIAQREAEHAQRSQKFLVGVLEDLNPYSSRHANRPNTADVIGNALARIDSDFADAPETQIELRTTIGDVLYRLDDLARARDVAHTNLDAMRALYGEASPKLGVGWSTYGQYSMDMGDLDTAGKAFASADAVLRDAGPSSAKLRVSLMTHWAKLENLRGDHVAAHGHHEAVLREHRAMQGGRSPDVVMDLMNLAGDDIYTDRYVQAEAQAQEAHAMLVDLLGAEHARRIYVDNVLGLAQALAGHTGEAIETLLSADALARAKLPADSAMHGAIQTSLGAARFHAGDFTAAIENLREARGIYLKNNDPASGRVVLWLGRAELAAGRPEALATLREACAALPAGSAAASDGLGELARAAYAAALARSGEGAQGLVQARAARDDLLKGKDAGGLRLADVDLLIADIAERQADPAAARTAREEALAVLRRVLGEAHPRTRALATMLES
jgi:serine/threonine-protein kinase